jgi:integrase
MATFKICVFPHQVRSGDGKYPVSIRVYWDRQYSYIGTEFYVTIHQIKQNNKKGIFELDDPFIINELTKRIQILEEVKVKTLGLKIHNYTAKELSRYFEKFLEGNIKDERIDFIAFAREYIKQKESEGKNMARLYTSLNCLEDYVKTRLICLYTIDLTSVFLSGFEKFLQQQRTITRKNQFGKSVTTTHQPVSLRTIADYMTDIRILFNAALNFYNDEENGIIKISHYPFKKYKLPAVPETQKRNLPPEQILQIIHATDELLALKRSILAKDVFALSFYLVGMNCIDLFNLKPEQNKDGRFTYNRTKTKNRRADSALISIKIEPEIIPLIQKYADPTGKMIFNFYSMYSDSHAFVSAIDTGLKDVARKLDIDIPLSSYYARHSWATIARNKCKISKHDIHECLNHVSDNSMKITDIYVEKDWSIIDEANCKVLNYLLSNF